MNTCVRTVSVVDDEPAVLRALSRLLSSAGFDVSSYPSARDFLESLPSLAPACAVLDVAMPGLSGLEVQRLLSETHYACHVVFLSGRADVSTSVRAMKAGAVDFLIKPVSESDLIEAVQTALDRHSNALEQRAEAESLQRRWSTLTSRERQVFRRVAGGQLNKQIAADLGTVEKTIKVHRHRVMTKMHARRITDLVRMADRLTLRAQ